MDDTAADITSGGREARIAEPVHQPRPKPCRFYLIERLRRLVGVAISRHVGHHDVEGVGRIAAMRARVHQERHDLRVAPERVGPAVREQERHRRRRTRAGTGVDKVDAEAVDSGAEPGQPIQPLLRLTPVEAVGPVGNEVAQLGDVDAGRPPNARGRIRPGRCKEPPSQLVKNGLLGARRERDNGIRIVHADTLLRRGADLAS